MCSIITFSVSIPEEPRKVRDETGKTMKITAEKTGMKTRSIVMTRKLTERKAA